MTQKPVDKNVYHDLKIANDDPYIPKKKAKDPKQFKIAQKLIDDEKIMALMQEIIEKQLGLNDDKIFILKDATNSMNVYTDSAKVYIGTPSNVVLASSLATSNK